jgi:hypothetical protein
MTDAERLAKLVRDVKDYARKNYGEDGWDFVVETQSDDDIAAQLTPDMTREQAIYEWQTIAKVWDEHRNDEEKNA